MITESSIGPPATFDEVAHARKLAALGEAWRELHGDKPFPTTIDQEFDLVNWIVNQPQKTQQIFGLQKQSMEISDIDRICSTARDSNHAKTLYRAICNAVACKIANAIR